MAAKFIIGIDLGGTNLKTAVLDLKYKIIDKEILSTQKFAKKENLIHSAAFKPRPLERGKNTPLSVSILNKSRSSDRGIEGLISAICYSVNKVIENNKLKKRDIIGVGLGLPGPIDQESGIVHFFPNIAGWKEVNLKSILEKRLRLSVFLDNDAKLMTLAEYKLGNASGFRNTLCLTLGTGVGGGLIIAGTLYRGEDNAAGEIGHLPINEKGPRCNCGGSACLETYIGNNRILEEARKSFKRNISLEELSAKAARQNKQALNIWLRVGRRLGIALVGVVNLLNLDAIVIGGGVAGAGKILFDKVRDTIKDRAMSVQARRVKVVRAKLGSQAGLIGAAILVTEKIK